MSALMRYIGLVIGLVPRRAVLGVYRRRWLATPLRSLLNALVPSGLREVTVAAGPLRGARLCLDLKREKYYWLGTYEPWVQEALRVHLRPGLAAWDVGAFIGYHTLLMRRIAGPGRVVALEPDPRNRQRLEENLRLNGARDVIVLPVAAGGERGSARLERSVGGPSMTRVVSSWETETPGETCEVVRLDDLLDGLPPPYLVKMDIEGGENDALMGASRILTEVRPVWIIELHGAPGEAALERLREAGYRVTMIGKGIDVAPDLPVGGPAHVVATP